MTNRYFTTKEQYLAFREKWSYAVNHGFGLTASHYMLYNLIRGHQPEYGFTPFQRLSKMRGQGYINHGCYQAWWTLKQHQRKAQEEKLSPYSKKVLERFLAPFGETFTKEDLASIEIPDVAPIYTSYGPGMQIVRKISAGEIAAPRTCMGLNALYKQIQEEIAAKKQAEVKEPAEPKPTPKPSLFKRIIDRVTSEVA